LAQTVKKKNCISAACSGSPKELAPTEPRIVKIQSVIISFPSSS
jgi:hypothetical protein